jgi:hypothetical protein
MSEIYMFICTPGLAGACSVDDRHKLWCGVHCGLQQVCVWASQSDVVLGL